MQSEIKHFQYSSELSVGEITIDDNPWFVAKDVCEILEIGNTSMAVDRLDEDEKMVSKLLISSKLRDVLIINESGLYHLVITSQKPEAKKFRKWITSEVLPEIRKEGKYTSKQEKAKSDRIKELRSELKTLKMEFSQARRAIADKEFELDTLIDTEPNQMEIFKNQ